MIDLFFIKTFVSIAKTGSFRVAAERNFITQPAVSQHIRTLEQKLGSPLLERKGRKVSLTPAGEVFLPCAEGMLKQYEEGKVRIAERMHKFDGTIHIVTIYSIGLYELPPVVKNCLKKYPQIKINLEYYHNARIYEIVSKRLADFGLVAFPKKAAGVVSKVFTEDKLVLVQSTQNKIFSKKRIAVTELNRVKFIAFASHTPTGKAIDQALKQRKAAPEIVQEYDNIETLKGAVLLGIGCALVPRNTIHRELKEHSLEIVEIQDFHLARPLGVLYPKGKILTKGTQAFLDLILKKNSGK